jgi:DNA-binding transcriptional LysR family regulator
MELYQLRYFLAVARFGSFTRAAEHEHVAQPSLSQQVRKLEDELGVRLFDRVGRRIRLTDFGAHFQERARRALEEVEGARQEVAHLMGLRQGTVWVGVIPTIAPYLLPQTLSAFAKAYPKYRRESKGRPDPAAPQSIDRRGFGPCLDEPSREGARSHCRGIVHRKHGACGSQAPPTLAPSSPRQDS